MPRSVAFGLMGVLGSPAWVVSAVLHGTVIAAIAVQVTHAPASAAPEPMQMIDIQAPEAAPAPEVRPEPVANVVAPRISSVLPPVKASPSPSPAVLPAAVALPSGELPSVVPAPASAAGPTFAMTLSSSGAGSTGRQGSTAVPAPASGATSDEVVEERGVSVRATVAYGPAPIYPRAARAAQIEKDLPIELVVSATGAVIDAHVVHPAGYGLDEAALDAIRRYRFTPAQRAGHPVAVRMLWTMQFHLQ